MPKILNIETGTNICSVALYDGETCLNIRETSEPNSHASILTVFIDEIFKTTGIKPESLDAISVGKGPGSYTGLRIGVSVAKGLCYGASKPLIAVNSLQSLHQGLLMSYSNFNYLPPPSKCIFFPMIDARRMEVYTAIFNHNSEELVPVSAQIIDATSFEKYLNEQPVVFFGSGADKCKNVILHQNAFFVPEFNASARYMSSISSLLFSQKKFEDIAYFEPFYLKDFIATTPGNKIL